MKGQRLRKEIACPEVQQDYATFFNAVDQNDRDSSDYTVSIRTKRWYLRYYFYLIDRIIHSMFVITTDTAKQGLIPEWDKYTKTDGRYKFQIDMAFALIDMGIKADWDFDDDNKADWMRKKDTLPCSCSQCTFCKAGKTTSPVKAEFPTVLKKKKLRPECNAIPLLLDKVGSCAYCRVCYYRVGQTNPEIKEYNEKRKCCRTTRKGCRGCNTLVCKERYEDYNHNFIGNVSKPNQQDKTKVD